jgi:hypothetical protein
MGKKFVKARGPMIIRAAALRDKPSEERLVELFGPNDEVFRGNARAQCRKCLRDFALVFALIDGEDNPGYLHDIEKMISDDCHGRQHHAEYVLKTHP